MVPVTNSASASLEAHRGEGSTLVPKPKTLTSAAEFER